MTILSYIVGLVSGWMIGFGTVYLYLIVKGKYVKEVVEENQELKNRLRRYFAYQDEINSD